MSEHPTCADCMVLSLPREVLPAAGMLVHYPSGQLARLTGVYQSRFSAMGQEWRVHQEAIPAGFIPQAWADEALATLRHHLYTP